jgi:hypothetical protein
MTLFKRSLIGALVALAVGSAQAANLVLDGNYVKIGVNELTGTLGSGGNTPPGILYDATGTGTFNAAYDYLTPGSPFEGWALKYNSTTVYNNNTGVRGLTGGILTGYDGVAYNGSTYDNRAVWTASHTDFDILHDYRFNNNQQFVDISTEVTAKTDMTNLYFGRFTDPDARAASGDSSATDNVIGYGAIPATNVVFSEAIASRYALGLYTSATNSGAAVSAGWSTDPVVYHTGGTSYGTGVNFGRGDHTIGLGFYLPTLANGSTATFSYAYIFGPSAFGAASTAITDGAGGGTPGVVPGGGTLVDVGSATDAATSTPSTPTVTGTSTTNIVTTVVTNSPWVLTTLAPVYAYATTSRPTPTIVNDRLVVSRVNTTTTSITDVQTRTVTTTVTTTPQTTTTYSDSTSTVTTGTATSAATTATETGSLTVSTPVGVTQTASAPTDTIDNAVLLNVYSQEMNRADPLSRINIHGDAITKRNTSTAADIARNTWMWITGKSANGNSDRSDGFEIGAERLVNDTTLVGAQYNRINSTMTGVESGSGRFDTNMINLYAVKKLGRWAVKPTVGYSNSDYDTARSITLGALDNFAAETYANKYSTNGKSYWADLQVIAPKVWKITPYAGLTVRKIELDGGVESGTAHTRLTYSNFSDTSSQPYVGARFDSATTERGLFYTLDGRVTKFNLADTYKYGETLTSVNSLVGYKINDRSQVTAGYQYQHTDQYTNGIISVGGKLDF